MNNNNYSSFLESEHKHYKREHTNKREEQKDEYDLSSVRCSSISNRNKDLFSRKQIKRWIERKIRDLLNIRYIKISKIYYKF